MWLPPLPFMPSCAPIWIGKRMKTPALPVPSHGMTKEYGGCYGSNLTNTVFRKCRFDFTDVSECNATFTVFEDGSYHFASFQGTAFISAKWRSSRMARDLRIQNASFQACQFIECQLSGVQFWNCEFSDCVWDSCHFSGVTFIGCVIDDRGKKNFEGYSQDQVQIYEEDPDLDPCPV